MSALARLMARITWFQMLRLMRRPWMRWLQESALRKLPPGAARGIRRSVADQNRFARKIGLPMLIVAYNALLASIAITSIYYLMLYLSLNDNLTVPEEVVRRLENR